MCFGALFRLSYKITISNKPYGVTAEGAVTVTVIKSVYIFPCSVYTVTVTVVVPAFLAVTTPLLDTVKIEESPEDHMVFSVRTVSSIAALPLLDPSEKTVFLS